MTRNNAATNKTPTDAEDLEIPAAAQALKPKKSLSDIADMLAQNHMKMRAGKSDTTPNEVKNEDDDKTKAQRVANGTRRTDANDAEDLEDTTEELNGLLSDEDDDVEDADTSGTDDSTVDDTDDVDEDDEDDVDDDDSTIADYFEIDDDDLLELDDDTQVSIADLKRVYKADESIAQEIEKQQTATSEALTMRARAQDDSMKAQEMVGALMKHIIETIQVPLIGPPNEGLKTTNPEQYIRHLEAYNEDQKRINDTETQLADAISTFAEHQKGQKETRKKEEMMVLTQKIPALSDPKTRPEASKDILDAAAHYGFSPEEVNEAIDHRVYRMAYDAQQYRKLMNASTKEEISLTEEKAKNKVRQTRTLRSKGTTAKTRLSGQAKRIKVLKKAAQSSGKPKDVAALLVAQRQKP